MTKLMTKKVLVAVGATVIAVSSGLAIAGGKYCDDRDGGYKGMNGGKYQVKRMARYLELTDEQKQSVETLFAEKREEGLARRELRKEFRADLQALDPTSPTYLNDVKELADKQADAMSEQMMDMAEIKVELYSVLTPEQIEKMEEMKERKLSRYDNDDDDGRHYGEKRHFW